MPLHIICERDVGLFSLIQQVIANTAWARIEGRTPVALLGNRCAYWTPHGHAGATTVWEYYFEPLVRDWPADAVSAAIREYIDANFPDPDHPGYPLNPTLGDTAGHIAGHTAVDATGPASFVTNHFGDHPRIPADVPRIPYTTGNPTAAMRTLTSAIIDLFIRPRSYITDRVEKFWTQHTSAGPVIGVHVRGTDAVSAAETRSFRRGSLDLGRYERVLTGLLEETPDARILVATDAEASLVRLKDRFGSRVIHTDAVRHTTGPAAGHGPTGWIMPAYLTADPSTAARNGEDAVVEYLLLTRTQHLVHNGASLATTVLLHQPGLPHTNTHTGHAR